MVIENTTVRSSATSLRILFAVFVETLVIWPEIVQTGNEGQIPEITFREHLRSDALVEAMLSIVRWR